MSDPARIPASLAVRPSTAAAILAAARHLLPDLQQGARIDSGRLRAALESAFGGSDAEGLWDWKTAYEALESATVLFLQQVGPALARRTAGPAGFLDRLNRIARLLPTHTRRSEESQALQQFSTPPGLAFAAAAAAAITPADLVLEPSAGTGLLAVFAALAGAGLHLNELADTRAELLAGLFVGAAISRHDAAHIDDFLEEGLRPSVVLMNPPFTAGAHVEGRVADAALRHIRSALARLLALTIAMQNTLFDVFEALLRAKIEGAISAGVYDHGVETIVADSLNLESRRTIYTHAGTGAETEVFTILKRERNKPLALDKVFALAQEKGAQLLVNTKSQRAALQVAAPAIMLDDGHIETRVRLIRPMDRLIYPADALAETAWELADSGDFGVAWEREVAEVPEFSESHLYMVTGLLLPIWRRLPNEGCRVYRLQTDDGRRIIGRQVTPDWIADQLGEAPQLAPTEAWDLLLKKGSTLTLDEGLTLRRRLVMGLQRIELDGFTDGMVDRLKALGLMSEIISWKLRMFVPVGDDGPKILAKVLERYALVCVNSREEGSR